MSSNKEMKLLILADSLNSGGAERQLALLACSMPLNWRVQVWSMGSGVFASKLRAAGIDVHLEERRYRVDMSPFFKLQSFISDFKPDIVHAWGWMSTLASFPVCRIGGIPLVSGLIRMGRAPLHQKKGRLIMRIASFADRAIANSRAGLVSWRIPINKGRVVPNGFDFQRLSLAHELKSGKSSFTVVMSANMTKLKDHCSLIKAARILSEEYGKSAFYFIALGNGPLMGEVTASASDLLSDGVIEFPGNVSDVIPYLMNADVGVLLSTLGEGCSNSIMEYMACGLPVVCTDAGGNRELVVNGKTGFLIPEFNCEALTDKLRILYTYRDQGRLMGEKGRRKLENEYSVEIMVLKTLDVYAEIL